MRISFTWKQIGWAIGFLCLVIFTGVGVYYGINNAISQIQEKVTEKLDRSEYEKKCIKDSINDMIILEKVDETSKDVKRILRKLDK